VLQRIFEREVTVEEVRAALGCGETIESHPEDRPYESCLVLGWVGGRPLHMVVADDEEEAMTIVVTVYRPSPASWEEGFRRRKR